MGDTRVNFSRRSFASHRVRQIYAGTWLALLFCLALVLAGCAMPGDAAPVVKIGVIAPFEGLGRPLGYAILPEIQQAIGEANAAGRFGRYRVLLVALNDDLNAATAADQARALTQDPDLLAVLGPWTADTAETVLSILNNAGIPLLAGAPIASPGGQSHSLCPAAGNVESAIVEKARLLGGSGKMARVGSTLPVAPGTILGYAGDAAAGADDLLRWREAGWAGNVAGGPDLFRPWLVDRAGGAAEGAVAGVCIPPGAPADAVIPDHHADQLARAGIDMLLDALAADVANGGPTRQGINAALSERDFSTGLTWFRVENGKWVTSD